MILTQCAVCATDLGLTRGKKCGRCSTRYCGAACQVQHWKEGGHDTLCKKIKRAGGAEQYNANNKYSEAARSRPGVRGRHQGPDVLHLHAGPALENEGGPRAWVRVPRDGGVCARVVPGGAGEDFVSLRPRRTINQENEAWARWYTCSLCEQDYHGVVSCALGWACWKTYLGRPEDRLGWWRWARLGTVYPPQDKTRTRLSVYAGRVGYDAAPWRIRRQPHSSCRAILRHVSRLGHLEKALNMERDVYSRTGEDGGQREQTTLQSANNYAAIVP